MERHEAIIIGGGLNGLTAAAYLARAGVDVLLLDRNEKLGVAEQGVELAPGFRLPRFRLGVNRLPTRTIFDLELPKFGLRIARLEGGVSLMNDGRYHASYADGLIYRRELGRLSSRDADAWPRFRRDMLRANRALDAALTHVMRDLSRPSLTALRELLGGADRLAKMPVEELHDLTRLWAQPCAAFLDSYFESEVLKAHLASSALAGTTLGPLAPSSARFLMNLFRNENGAASGGAPATVMTLGGPDALIDAFVASIKASGGDVRTEAEVTDILLKDGKAQGVVLADGAEIMADAVLSDLDLKRSFLTLFAWKDLPKGFVERVGQFRLRGVTAKINLALDALPAFPAIPKDCPALAGGIRLVQAVDELERTYDDWRHSMPPRTPLIEMLIPSMVDRSFAPPGKHVMSVALHYVPEQLHDGDWTPERKQELATRALTAIAAQSPDIVDRITAVETLVPPDVENEVGLTSGDFEQGEMTLDQLFVNRPMPGLSGYETPIRNFYLCSGSAHPGALEVGGAGAGAARRVLDALGKKADARKGRAS